MYWIRQRRVAAGNHVVGGVGANHGDPPLVKQWQTGRLACRAADLLEITWPFHITTGELPRANEQHIALIDTETALFLCGEYVIGHDSLAPFKPVHAANHLRVHQDGFSHNAVLRKLDRLRRRAEVRRDQMRGPAVVHLALPKEVGRRVHVGDRAAVNPHGDLVHRDLWGLDVTLFPVAQPSPL